MKITTLLPIVSLVLAAPGAMAQAEAPAAPAAPAADKKADVEITITGDDTMKFSTQALEATEGQVVKLTFKNVGKIPKAAMGHNWVLLAKDTDVTAFAKKAMAAKATDFIPSAEEDKKLIIAHTKLLGPGESDTIIFTAPKAGTYKYICAFPGHYAMMNGVFTVKAK